MAVPTPKTWAAGELVDSSELNAEVRDVFNFLLGTPRALAYRDADVAIPDTTFTLVPWNNELYDSNSAHSLVTNVSRLVAPESGLYAINMQSTFTANGTGWREASLRKNAADLVSGGTELGKDALSAIGGGPTTAVHVYVEAQLNAGDYVQCFLKQTSGGSLNLLAGSGNSFMEFRWMAKTST